MHNRLILEAFVKAKEKTGNEKRHHLAKQLSSNIFKESNERLTSARIAQYHLNASRNSKKIVLRPYVEKAFLDYLGYTSMQAFLEDFPNEPTRYGNLIRLWKKCWFKFLIYHLFLLILAISIYLYATRQRWMVWEDNHYIEVKFDKQYGTRLKLYKQERIDNFRRIDANCSTEFFNQDGNPKIWYGKNKEGQLEYFTDLGLHPETGKTLKKITEYMVDTHVCPEGNSTID